MNAPHQPDLMPAPMGLTAESAPADGHFNFAYLDERTKRMIRRAILKAVAIPGYQVPFWSRARCHCPMAGAPAASR